MVARFLNAWPHFKLRLIYRKQWISLLLAASAASGFAAGAGGQQLTPSPFAFPPPNSWSRLPAQALRDQQMRRMQMMPVIRRAVTKAQLNQALIAKAYRRNVVHVASLLAQGANPNAFDRAGVPALFYAVAVKDNLRVISLLLRKGANVNARDPLGNTVLAEAVPLKADPIALLLLQHKADPNVRNGAGLTPLGIAAAQNDTPSPCWGGSATKPLLAFFA